VRLPASTAAPVSVSRLVIIEYSFRCDRIAYLTVAIYTIDVAHTWRGSETISAQGRFGRRAPRGVRTHPSNTSRDMAFYGVAGEVLYPSQGLFYFKVADTLLMSATFRA
jgi:hypothetical protein